ncbi:SSI family serine proteinase inhibitor [Jidongwangia harbinensis]|uniref:SSI family serine proteinase inhibitor n=1 Tax=Jidongwangia harbinensis TaxID=2878561 RepID=UPI001CD91C86|nr:SSI family serine proteinase inhibitor [Jidongwangia harbinensis]MCA2212410.1 subtilase-type protease inhibitor [Jidongwangia harbinensis]
MIRSLLTTAAVAAAVVAVAGPAAATATGPAAAPRPPKITELDLSYTAAAGYAAAVYLTCKPAGGGHPKPKKACATLAKAGANPDRLKPARTMCTMEYDPIVAAVTGTWKGKPVNWSREYPNPCAMIRATGILFQF